MATEPEEEQEPEGEESTYEDEEGEGGPVKTFLEHLEDLRWTLIKSFSALIVGMIVCLAAARHLIEIFKWPLVRTGADIRLETFGPMSGFMISLKMAFYGGVVLALPFLLYFIGEFILPAMKKKEKKYFLRAFCFGTGLFVIGVLACYFFMLDVSLRAMIAYNDYVRLPSEMWRADDYFQFVTRFVIGVGIAFELPVVILTLVKLGVIQHRTLVNGRKYMLVINAIFAALITPADIFSTILLTIPLQLLFEMCIWISAIWERKKRHIAATGAGA